MTTVTVSTIQATIAGALAKFLRERARIERAATLVALGHVTEVRADAFAVTSQTDATTVYMVTQSDGCPALTASAAPS